MRLIRKNRDEQASQIIELFPSIPKTTITAYIHHHPTLQTVDLILHFLETNEPTTKSVDLNTDLLLAQARTILNNRKKENAKTEQKIEDEKISLNEENIVKIRGIVSEYEISHVNSTIAGKIYNKINQIRLTKKRAKLILDDFMVNIAHAYSNEIMNGYISLDSDSYEDWIRSYPETLTDYKFSCGFVPCVGSPINSISQMLEKQEQFKKTIFSTAHYCGIGVSISKKMSYFFVIIVANID